MGGRIVSNGFCVRRHAKSRTYLYRLAVLKPEYDLVDQHHLLQEPSFIAPLIERNRCWNIKSNFDYQKFVAAAKMMQGSHNFASFAAASRDIREGPPKSPCKTIKYIGVDVGRPILDPKYEPLSGCFNYFDITINSRSFLYNQVIS